MNRSKYFLIRTCAITLFSLFILSACETGVYGPSRPSSNPVPTVTAAEHARRGNHNAAARGYRQLASRSSGIQRDKYLLEAAQQWFEVQQYQNAQRDLSSIRNMLDAKSQVRKILLQTRVLLELDMPMQALTSINTLDPQSSADIARPYYGLKGHAFFALGQTTDGARQFLERERFMRNAEELQDNRQRLWNLLNQNLIAGFSETLDPDETLLNGWISAVAAFNSAPNARLKRRALTEWSAEFPGHPAFEIGLNNLYSDQDEFTGGSIAPLGNIERVGVLLPLSGRLARAGEVIRQGIVSANQRRILPFQLSFHDTGLGAINAYAEAMTYDVDALIGPLNKSSIEEIEPRLGSVPVLALNRVDNEFGIANLLQFGLAPEDEAIAAAEYALTEGYTQALTLTPSTDWGRRVVQAFQTRFENGGGILLEQANYSTRENDHSVAITGMLNVDESKQRFRQLSWLLGNEIEYEARRRQDVDFIFLGADSKQGRLIRPQLKFHYASRIPVIATSSIYEADPVRNKDLNGVHITLSDWIIDPLQTDPELASTLNITPDNPSNSQLLQLISLGFDAINYLDQLSIDPLTPYQGLSGELSINEIGVIQRKLPLALVSGGQVEKTHEIVRELEPLDDELSDEEYSDIDPGE
ncbi:MAG: penicillin-binding protein activator [Gammaproteobacteria bacterium]|nr:penicillin-binding protein activator [Gammaproteobacteria bacterium]NNC97319.1 penicillin-binding protein activator [Gammaproteobacteria bacterium]NNM14657.1 penicillin-binding protein activator [Gammaproteobacteria bacterium]